jgi:hypothetical protein
MDLKPPVRGAGLIWSFKTFDECILILKEGHKPCLLNNS